MVLRPRAHDCQKEDGDDRERGDLRHEAVRSGGDAGSYESSSRNHEEGEIDRHEFQSDAAKGDDAPNFPAHVATPSYSRDTL